MGIESVGHQLKLPIRWNEGYCSIILKPAEHIKCDNWREVAWFKPGKTNTLVELDVFQLNRLRFATSSWLEEHLGCEKLGFHPKQREEQLHARPPCHWDQASALASRWDKPVILTFQRLFVPVLYSYSHLDCSNNLWEENISWGARQQVHTLNHIKENLQPKISGNRVRKLLKMVYTGKKNSTSFLRYLMPSGRQETALVTAGGGLGAASNLYPSWIVRTCIQAVWKSKLCHLSDILLENLGICGLGVAKVNQLVK